jgi:hypothetical protein
MVREPAFDANDLLGRFSDARCFLECAVCSLNEREDACHPGRELVCLRHGLELLRGVYNELDLRIGRGQA